MNQTEELLENVVTAFNGKRQNPIHQNGFVMIINFICCIFGLPLNGFIAFLIIYMRRLRSKARNIFLLGLILSNLSAFVPVLIEFAYFHFPSDNLCQNYVAVVGLPYVLFLTNMLLALADRYAALAYPLWHLKKVSVGLVIRWQLVTSALVSVIYKFAYIAQILPLSCEVQLLQVRIIAITLFALFFTCVLAQIVVYRQTRQILAEYMPNGPLERRRIIPSSEEAQNVDASHITKHIRPTIASNSDGGRSINVHMPEHAISQMEMEATRTLIFSVMSLTIMTGPFILFTFSVFLCRLCFDQPICNSFSWLAPYFKELVVVHAVYHPIINICRSSELSTVLKQRLNM